MSGLLWPTTDTPGVKGYRCDNAGSSESRSLPQKQNTAGQSGGLVWPPPTQLPGSPAGRQRARDQGSPLHKYRWGRGSAGELTRGFHPREAHFRGMWLLLYLDTKPP